MAKHRFAALVVSLSVAMPALAERLIFEGSCPPERIRFPAITPDGGAV